MTALPNSPLPAAGAAELLRWILRRRARYRVSGESMLPTLAAGDVVLVDRLARPAEVDIVCAQHPHDPSTTVIKRVGFIDEVGALFLQSDNALAEGSADSNRFGVVDPELVRGVVTSVVRKPRGV